MKRVVILNDQDNVATSLVALEASAQVDVEVDGAPLALSVRDAIPFGHKIAIRPVAVGEPVLKYGQVIGTASKAITPGDWVHVHNVESARARGDRT